MDERSDATQDRTLFYEDFHYGRTFTSATRRVTEDDLLTFAHLSGDLNRLHVDSEYAAKTQFGQRVVHGPFGIAMVMGMFHEMGILEHSALALLDVAWHFRAPIFVDDDIHMAVTIVGRRLTSSGQTGILSRHIQLMNASGSTVQEGSMGLLIRVADPDTARAADLAKPTPFTSVWAQRVAELANQDPEFATSARAFDGSIAVRAGTAEFAFKIFEGAVLKASPRLTAGATFTVLATEHTWLDLFTRPRNEFIAMASDGAFQVSGNIQEYLRLTKAFSIILDVARGLV
jgi:acyl dehydratase